MTRLAPTPSGYLHFGNAVSCVVTVLLARSRGAEIRLRIDDLDRERFKEVYLEEIFTTLDWLGIVPDEGPSGPTDFLQNHSQHLRLDRYTRMINLLTERKALYTCRCSRRAFNEKADYLCHCLSEDYAPAEGFIERLNFLPEHLSFNDFDGIGYNLALRLEPGSIPVVQRNGMPSYQIASLCDDLDFGVDLIVRGEDLTASTAYQMYLSRLLGEQSFTRTAFFHHGLMYDSGTKLSKSEGAYSLHAMREGGMTASAFYGQLCSVFGIPPAGGDNLETIHNKLNGRLTETFRRNLPSRIHDHLS